MESVNLGDIFYRVNTSLNILRDKVVMEMDGQTWVRYKKPIREYTIEKYTVVGIISYELNTDKNNDKNLSKYLEETGLPLNQNIILCSDDGHYDNWEIVCLNKYLYKNLEDAENCIKIKQEKDKDSNIPSGHSLK